MDSQFSGNNGKLRVHIAFEIISSLKGKLYSVIMDKLTRFAICY